MTPDERNQFYQLSTAGDAARAWRWHPVFLGLCLVVVVYGMLGLLALLLRY